MSWSPAAAPAANQRERQLAIVGVLAGAGLSVGLAWRAPYFLSNALFFWASQLAVLALLRPLRPRPAIVAGTAFALAAYLAAFDAWLFSRDNPESLAWLGYVFSLPGALIGAILALLWLRGRLVHGAVAAACLSAALVLVGIAINQTIVCKTLLYCGR